MMESRIPFWSAEWWIGVVVVGVAVHLLAAYLKPRFDRVGGWTSRAWAARSEKRTLARLARIDDLKRNNDKRLAASFSELRCRIRAVQSLLLAVPGIVLLVLLVTIAGPRVSVRILVAMIGLLALLGLFLGLDDHLDSMRIRGELSKALKDAADQGTA